MSGRDCPKRLRCRGCRHCEPWRAERDKARATASGWTLKRLAKVVAARGGVLVVGRHMRTRDGELVAWRSRA